MARSVCAMDMVDSALKTLDLTLLKYDKSFGTLAQGKCLRTSFDGVLRRFFLVRYRLFAPIKTIVNAILLS